MADTTTDPNDSNVINTASVQKMVAKTVDVVLNSSPVSLRLLGNQKPWKREFPVKVASGIAGKSFDGLEKFSTSRSDSFRKMAFKPTGYEINVAMAQMDIDVNKARESKIDIIARELQSRQEDMIDDIASMLYTVQTDKAFLSIRDACDNGTIGAATYGGLTRATYDGLDGNYTASATGMTLALLRTKFAACTHGNGKPDMIVTTKDLWADYEVLVSGTASAHLVLTNKGYPQLTRTGILPTVQALKGQRGFDVLYFSGAPMVVDESIASGDMYMLNTDHLAFYGVKSTDPEYTPVMFANGSIDSVYSDVPKTTGFAWSGFDRPIDQYGKVGHIILMGNLISDAPRFLGMEDSFT